MTKSIFLVGLIILANACAVTGGTGGSAYTETGAICDNPGLDSRLVYLKDQSDSVRGVLGVGLPSGGGAIGGQKSNADVTREWNVLENRLNRFDAEIEGQHRNVVASCKNHARCMEMRNYKEGQCIASMNRWDDAEEAFSDLSLEIRRIEADVEKTRIIAGRRHRGRGYDVNRYKGRDRDCSSSTGPFC